MLKYYHIISDLYVVSLEFQYFLVTRTKAKFSLYRRVFRYYTCHVLIPMRTQVYSGVWYLDLIIVSSDLLSPD